MDSCRTTCPQRKFLHNFHSQVWLIPQSIRFQIPFKISKFLSSGHRAQATSDNVKHRKIKIVTCVNFQPMCYPTSCLPSFHNGPSSYPLLFAQEWNSGEESWEFSVKHFNDIVSQDNDTIHFTTLQLISHGAR